MVGGSSRFLRAEALRNDKICLENIALIENVALITKSQIMQSPKMKNRTNA